MDQKFEIASQERLKFVEKISDLFMQKVMGRLEENYALAFITDESHLSDFSPPNDIDKKHRDGEHGKKIFSYVAVFREKGIPFSKARREERETDPYYPVYFKNDILRITEEVFGVDIYEVINNPIVEICHYLATNMTNEYKLELGLIKGDEK